MKTLKLIFLLLIILIPELYSQTPLKYNLSILRSHDLSDSYGGGNMLSGEMMISKSWYGVSIGFGYLQSLSHITYSLTIEDINKTLSIKSPELSNLKNGSFCLIAIPIMKKWFSTELSFGLAYASAKEMFLSNVEYSYDWTENKFNYINREYILIERKHFGYQAGIGLRFKVYKPLGIKLNFSLQDLKDATFVFAGYGIDFTF